MNSLVLQIIINRLEEVKRKQLNQKILPCSLRENIKISAKKMYKDFEENNELDEIINNNIEDKEFSEYLD